MKLALAGALFAASFSWCVESTACTPIDYGDISLPRGSVPTQMVARAASIELMRVERRDLVRDTGVYEWGPIYRYTLRNVETLAGRSRGPLRTLALDSSAPWFQFDRIGQRWWEPPFDGIPNLDFPDDLSDEWAFGLQACSDYADFQIGGMYLVFRDRSGAFLRPTHELLSSRAGVLAINGPSFERVRDRDDPWLTEIRAEIERQGPRQPIFLDWLFDAVFGAPRR